MQILKQVCGDYATNCYILKTKEGDFIIDPGFNAFEFIEKNVQNPRAILNTHGHFDHVWDNAKVKEYFKIPIYIHKNDEFMLEDPFNMGHAHSKADVVISDDKEIELYGLKFRYLLYPGHSPGCCMIELVGQGLAFSGDFLFKSSIGRYDLPFSDAQAMKTSLQRALELKEDLKLYPGHGLESTLKEEQANIPFWLRQF